MSDITIIAMAAKTSLQEIGKQASALGAGLQNVAPIEKEGKTANPSAEYLIMTGNQILEKAKSINFNQLTQEFDSTPPQSSL